MMMYSQENTTHLADTQTYYSYNESMSNGEEPSYYQSTQEAEDWDMDLDHEEACYAQYDFEMANAVAEADYEDMYEQEHYNSQEYASDEEYEEEEEEEYEDDQDDALLSLVLGVQNYLTEQASHHAEQSPLYNLQYKMYTYMRHRALQLGLAA